MTNRIYFCTFKVEVTVTLFKSVGDSICWLFECEHIVCTFQCSFQTQWTRKYEICLEMTGNRFGLHKRRLVGGKMQIGFNCYFYYESQEDIAH